MNITNTAYCYNFLSAHLPYYVKIRNINKHEYNTLMMWIIKHVNINECQTPDYRESGTITFQFLSKTHHDQFNYIYKHIIETI